MVKSRESSLRKIYARLFNVFGPQRWWPAKTKFEIIVGAILTQNTNWGNVEKALGNLKEKRLLSPGGLEGVSSRKLASLIKPAGYFNVKAKRLKNFMRFFYDVYQGNLRKMARTPSQTLRKQLLAVNGIGPETADSILLYALGKPAFVVDAYTKRIFYRHNIVGDDDDYHSIQRVFMEGLTPDAKLYNEYHALIVHLGKHYCKPDPLCRQCPINRILYSLKYKCQKCHRAVLYGKEKEAAKTKSGFLCQRCALKGKGDALQKRKD